MGATYQRWTAVSVSAKVAEIQARLTANPPQPGQQMSALINELQVLPEEWRGLALQCATTGYSYGVEVNTIEKRKYIRETVLCCVGVLFIVLAVLLLFIRPSISPEQLFGCCFLLSLGAAGFLVFFPGFLSLSGAIKKPFQWFESLKFKAGGAVAIFLLVLVISWSFLNRIHH